MLYAHERMAELWMIQQKNHGVLSVEQEQEMVTCLQINLEYVHKYHKLLNLSLVAFEANDYDWMHEICGLMEALQLAYKMKDVRRVK